MPTDSSRTFGLHLYTPLGGPYRIEALREEVRTYENNDTKRIAESRITRLLADIGGDTVPGGPVTVTTYDDLKDLVSACAAAFAAEDAEVEEDPPDDP